MQLPDLLISADNHVTEPLDLWTRNLPEELRHRGPRLEVVDGRGCLLVEGTVIKRFSRRVRSDDPAVVTETAEGEARQALVSFGENDPDLRLKDLDADGVWGDVMYPNIAFFCAYRVSDGALQAAICRLYNDWIADRFLGASPRFCPVALLPVLDVDAAVEEVARVRARGFRAGLLADHVDLRPYNDPAYEPLWRAAEDHALPLTFHAGTGRDQTPAHGPGGAVVNYVVTVGGPMETVAYLCGAGVLARHPELQVVIVEAGSGWLAWVLHAMDDAYREHAAWVEPKLDLLPSEYFRRQGHVTFQHDPIGFANVPFTGDDCLMWGADYPHPEGTWPKSREYLAAQLSGVPSATVDKALWSNAARIYGFDLPT